MQLLALCLVILLANLPSHFASPGPHQNNSDINSVGSLYGLDGGKLVTTISELPLPYTKSVLISTLGTTTPPNTDDDIGPTLPHEDQMTFSSPLPGDQTSDTILEQQNNSLPEDQYCETETCKALVSRMFSLMNQSADPCIDFYEYSCGGIRTTGSNLTDDPETEIEKRITDVMSNINEGSPQSYRHFVNFYNSCMTYEENVNYTERVAKVNALLGEVGSFHDSDSWPGTINLTTLIFRLHKLKSTHLFQVSLTKFTTDFSLDIHPNYPNPPGVNCSDELNARKIMAGETEDINKSYEEYLQCKRNATEDLESMEVSLRALGVFESMPESNRSQLLEEIILNVKKTVLDFPKDHLPGIVDFSQTLSRSLDYKLTTIDELQHKYTLVDWQELTSSYLGQSVPGNTTVHLHFSDYFDQLFQELGDTDLRMLNNALLAILAHQLYEELVVPRPSNDLPLICMTKVRSFIGDVASLIYIDSFLPEQIQTLKKQTYEMFSLSKTTLEKELRSAKWLQNNTETLDQLVNKLTDMTLNFGDQKNTPASEVYMNQVPVDGDYFDWFIELIKLPDNIRHNSLVQSGQKFWRTDISPFAILELNAVYISLGALESPFMFDEVPHYISMATTGHYIGHEIGHHFDLTGITSGGRVQLRLSEQAEVAYNAHKNCGESEFSSKRSYTTSDGGIAEVQIPGRLSVNERKADEIGTHVAMQAYLAWLESDQVKRNRDGHRLLPLLGLTREQTFFVAQAQMFCSKSTILDYRRSLFEGVYLPPFLRVKSIMSNSQKFTETFKCQPGQAMNPPDKCPPFPVF